MNRSTYQFVYVISSRRSLRFNGAKVSLIYDVSARDLHVGPGTSFVDKTTILPVGDKQDTHDGAVHNVVLINRAHFCVVSIRTNVCGFSSGRRLVSPARQYFSDVRYVTPNLSPISAVVGVTGYQ